MTLSDLRRMLDVSVGRADLADQYDIWINRGVRAIQRDYNFNCMRHVAEVVMLSGTSSVQMPGDFKQLQIEKGAVALKDPVNNGRIPLFVKTRERMICQTQLPNRQTSPDVYVSNDGEFAFLNILDNTTSDTTFEIAYFRYLPKLEAGNDQNYFTIEFEDMVQARVKEVAFSVINDPLEAAEKAKYRIQLAEAKVFDTLQRMQGRTVQMGG